MLRTIKAVAEADGTVRLLERVRLDSARRAILTILEEDDEDVLSSSALLSEAALAAD